MMKFLLKHSGFRWLAGGFLLGAILGICFFVLMAPATGGSGANLPPESKQALAGELAQSGKLLEEGKIDEAVAALERLIRRFPERPEPYNNLAVLQASQGQLESSRETLEKGLKTNESYAAIYENLGVIYSEIARNSYGKALRLDLPPSTPQLKVLTFPVPIHPQAKALPTQGPARVSTPAAEIAQAPKAAISAQTGPSAPGSSPPAKGPAEKKPPAPPAPEKELLRALEAWAKAWSEQDAERYLSFYSGKFVIEGGDDRAAWEAQRKQRLQHPSWISVKLRNIILTRTGPDTFQAKFIQEYRADTYQDRTRKALDLVHENGSWRILTESSLGRAR